MTFVISELNFKFRYTGSVLSTDTSRPTFLNFQVAGPTFLKCEVFFFLIIRRNANCFSSISRIQSINSYRISINLFYIQTVTETVVNIIFLTFFVVAK